MKTIVIYTSQTGFTKRYAEWIAEASGAECLALSEAKKKDLRGYGAIVFGGWACAGGIRGMGWFKKHIQEWAGKTLIAFCVGAGPLESPEIGPALNRNFTEEERGRVHVFYCPGGLNYSKMPAPSRWMLKMFHNMLKAKKNKTEQEEAKVKMLLVSYDISNKSYIAPILACLSEKKSNATAG